VCVCVRGMIRYDEKKTERILKRAADARNY